MTFAIGSVGGIILGALCGFTGATAYGTIRGTAIGLVMFLGSYGLGIFIAVTS